VTVTLSSFACQHGTWQDQSCVTEPGATFSQPMTLNIYNVNDSGTQGALIATSTQTFDVPYRPSVSPKCSDGKWLTPQKDCKNGLATDVTFSNFSPSHVSLPDTVVYEISYNTSNYGPHPTGVAGPADSLNVAIADAPSVWKDGRLPLIDGSQSAVNGMPPSVQFKAGNGLKLCRIRVGACHCRPPRFHRRPDQPHFRDGHRAGSRRRRRQALASVGVGRPRPTAGVVRWIIGSRAASRRHSRRHTSVVAPETRRARELFAGRCSSTAAQMRAASVSTGGMRVAVEISACRSWTVTVVGVSAARGTPRPLASRHPSHPVRSGCLPSSRASRRADAAELT
jgi:hypothetical protein